MLEEILKDYTHNENPIYSKTIYNSMLRKWPNKETITLYRGMNFTTKDEYDNFLKTFLKDGGYINDSAAGFSSLYETAIELAVSPKTYFPDEDTIATDSLRPDTPHK